METFSDIINGNKLVLIDFYADWCGPCKAMSPIIASLGKELKDKVRVLKIDIDKNPAISHKYNIQAVPTLMIFNKGNILWRNAGAMDKNSLLRQINTFL